MITNEYFIDKAEQYITDPISERVANTLSGIAMRLKKDTRNNGLLIKFRDNNHHADAVVRALGIDELTQGKSPVLQPAMARIYHYPRMMADHKGTFYDGKLYDGNVLPVLGKLPLLTAVTALQAASVRVTRDKNGQLVGDRSYGSVTTDYGLSTGPQGPGGEAGAYRVVATLQTRANT